MTRRRRRAPALALIALGAAVALGGCGTPPWEASAAAEEGTTTGESASEAGTVVDEADDGDLPVVGPSSTAGSDDGAASEGSDSDSDSDSEEASSPAPVAGPGVPTVVDDLATGSAERQLVAGAAVLEVDYWSTLPRDEWSPSGTKPLTLVVGADAPGATLLASLTVEVDRLTVDGWQSVPDDAVTQPFVTASGADVLLPSTAGASVLVGDVEDDTRALRYTFVYTVTSTDHPLPVQAVATDTLVVTLPDR
ncbi:hypothetical protein ACPYO6_12490 [Georgenia sp. Z1344]|uniref:hypothetical protein n=1 Tax=Georgenia sp. Z1344 TaxID=3416706 RepID=UPI003CF214B2